VENTLSKKLDDYLLKSEQAGRSYDTALSQFDVVLN
jgi:hypothetical protein